MLFWTWFAWPYRSALQSQLIFLGMDRKHVSVDCLPEQPISWHLN